MRAFELEHLIIAEKNDDFYVMLHTLSLNSLSGLSSVCYKSTLITGGVGGAGPKTSKLRTFFYDPWL